MPAKTRLLCIICFGLLPLIVLFFQPVYGRALLSGVGTDFMPAPTLLSPTTEDIDMSGKDALDFKWERGFLGSTDYFDLRLYKGYATNNESLILKDRYSAADYPVSVPASKFEAGQVYTWVLRQVFNDGRKSDKASSSFKVIRK